LEARIALDAERLKILADYQGVDLFLMDSEYRQLSASHSELAKKTSALIKTIKEQFSMPSELAGFSQEIRVGRDPVEFFFAPIGADPSDQKLIAGWMGVGLNKRDQIQMRNQVILWISLLAAVIGIAVMAITIRVSDRITKPVTELVRATEMMKLGEWVHPVDSDAKTEIGVLVKRFNEMTQNVQVTKRALELKLEELASAHGELTKTQGQLVQSAKMSSLGQLVAGVAHELNNPIAFIYSNMTQMRSYLKNLDKLDRVIHLLEEKIPEQDAKFLKASLDEIEWTYVRQDMGEMVQSCLDGSIRVKDIVSGLRNFSRLDKGEIAELDVNRSLENTAKLLSSEIKNRVEIIWDLCPDARMRANTSQLNQVFMNIMANGLQSIEGRGKVWIKTSLEKIESDEFMVISLRDSGRGIKSEHIDKIFDPFFTTKKVGEGTGLGLSIVYGIIERHRGTINVKSRLEPEPAHGTEFIIRLPRWGLVTGSREPESAA
jgi:two-component system NtrC family sensor kinase